MREMIIDAYQYQELNKTAKSFVVCWLEEYPIEYENEEERTVWLGVDEKIIAEYCNSNGYLFDRYGDPVHHLEKEKEKLL